MNTTDGDAERALAWFNKSLESEYPPEPNKDEYENCVRCIRAALQSTRKPDDITVPREVLMGVREALQKFQTIIMSKEFTGVFAVAAIHGCMYKGDSIDVEKALSTLDAFLSEGRWGGQV